MCANASPDKHPGPGERQADAGPTHAPPGRVGRHGRRREQGAEPLCGSAGTVSDAQSGQEIDAGRGAEASFLRDEGASVGASRTRVKGCGLGWSCRWEHLWLLFLSSADQRAALHRHRGGCRRHGDGVRKAEGRRAGVVWRGMRVGLMG